MLLFCPFLRDYHCLSCVVYSLVSITLLQLKKHSCYGAATETKISMEKLPAC